MRDFAHESIGIAAQFRGPRDSGNGGYVAGSIAQAIDSLAVLDGSKARRVSSAEGYALSVRLCKPTPLDTPLVLAQNAIESYVMTQATTADAVADAISADAVIAAASWQPWTPPDVPRLPTTAALRQASLRYRGFAGSAAESLYEHCFVCSRQRRESDGLGVFAGPLQHSLTVACDWHSDERWCEAQARRQVASRFVWAALDCPGYFAVGADRAPCLLAEMQLRQLRPVPSAAPLAILGWPLQFSGRRRLAATGIFSASGEVLALAKTLWVEPRSNAR